MTAIDEIKARIDIVDLVSETVKLRRAGKNYTGFCPFHSNSRTPAFVVWPESGTWRCFGQCNEGGDIFRFVMKKEGWDFPETLRRLAERAGVQLEPVAQADRQAADEHERLRGLLEEAVIFYRHQLLQNPAGRPALEYLHRRGLQDATIETWGLGYGPAGWDAILQHFTGRGYSTTELSQVGLVSERESGGFYDRFRNRITFPIRDPLGRMAGFGARILDPNDIPKFLNSPQTVLFDKGRLLYGLDQARKAIRAQDQVVIVEGYMDVIALHQAGFANTVSPMGTALTEDQLRMLKRFTRRIVLALDPDAAGEKATLRGLEVARQAMDRSEELVFNARGLLQHEARLQADLRVTTLPEGLDPDEIANRSPAEWGAIVAAARPVVVHVMETLARGHNLEDPKEKSAIASQVLPLIEDVPDAVERDAYRQQLARLLHVNEHALVGKPAPARANRPRSGAARTAPDRAAQTPARESSTRPAQSTESFALGVLIQRPDAIYLLDRSLQQAGLARLSIQDFDQTDHQLIFRLIQQSLDQEEMDSADYILEHLAPGLQDLGRGLLKPEIKEIPFDMQMEELFRTVIRMRSLHVARSLEQLIFLQEDVQQQGDVRAQPYGDLVLQHIHARERLDRALKRDTK